MFYRHITLAFCWALLIFGLHCIPGFDLKYRDPWQLLRMDKLVHMGMFAMFVVMLMAGFRKQDRFRTLRLHSRKWSLLISIVYGGVLEFVQGTFFLERTTDVYDFVANTIGSFLGLFLFRIIYGSELAKAVR